MKPQLFRRSLAIAAVLVLSALSTVRLSAGQFKWMMGGDKDIKYTTYRDPAGRFEIEYPTKDWRLLPSPGSTLAVFSRNDGPTMFIEASKMTDVLTAAELETLPEIELARLKEQQPKATDVKSEWLDSKSGRGVLIRYSRVAAEPEAVVQYSIPLVKDLYRLNGVMPMRLTMKNEPVIMNMIQSFKVATTPAATQPR